MAVLLNAQFKQQLGQLHDVPSAAKGFQTHKRLRKRASADVETRGTTTLLPFLFR